MILEIRKILARLVLFTDSSVRIQDKLLYAYNVLINLAPIAFLLNMFNWWWKDNEQFGSFMCVALVINLIVGCWYHLKNNTFNWKLFITRNIEMTFIVVVGYIMLETLRYTAGDNFAGEVFRITIQICTLLFPVSKVLKNIYILSNEKYPPKFFMEKLYNFEKNGDLNDLFNKTKNKNEL